MTPSSPIPSTTWDQDAAKITANILLEIGAVNVRPQHPYTLTSGWKSPVYIDCRKIIFYPRARQRIIQLSVEKIQRHIGYESLDIIVGGETAGIPFGAWIADKMMTPMAYVRKKPKGFGNNAYIEGNLPTNMRTLLVEDLTSDGKSKLRFAKTLRDAGAIVEHTFVVFFYGAFPGAIQNLTKAGLSLHALTTWYDILGVCEKKPYFDGETTEQIRLFLKDPCAWSGQHGGPSSADK